MISRNIETGTRNGRSFIKKGHKQIFRKDKNMFSEKLIKKLVVIECYFHSKKDIPFIIYLLEFYLFPYDVTWNYVLIHELYM